MSNRQKLAIWGGVPAVKFPEPHFIWGQPTISQLEALNDYIKQNNPMSIYGDDGIYRVLERKIEELYTNNYCILTNTGTSSLNSAYVGIGLKAGDEVIVPTYTFLATVTPLLRIGAVPIFVDANPDTGNIDPADIKRKISTKTKAIVITHMWGVPCDMNKILPIVKAFNLKLVEDCSHAHLTKYGVDLCGTFGDAACFSIGSKKTWTCGEGGFLITNDPEVYIRATLLGHFEKRVRVALDRLHNEGYTHLVKKYQALKSGYGENYRMHPYSAVMALAFLVNDLETVIQKRSESLRYFSKCLEQVNGISPPLLPDDYYTGAMYGYKARLNPHEISGEISVERLVKAIQYERVKIKLPDSGTLHNDPVFMENYYNHNISSYSRSEGEFSGALSYLRNRVSLPTFSGGLSQDREIIHQYCEGFHKVLSQAELLTNLEDN